MSCIPNENPDAKLDPICRIPYIVLILGVLIAFIGSFKPQLGATGYQIHWVLFVVGLIPYVIYSGFLIMPNVRWLAVSGIILVVADLALRGLAPDLNLPVGYEPLWLVVLLLVTVGIAALAPRQRPAVHAEEPPTPPAEADRPG